MKGKISLGDFIRDVKNELVQATKDRKDDPFFALTDIELEASFSLEAEGEVGMKFVVEAKGTTTASQVHKVTLKFKTLAPAFDDLQLIPQVECDFPKDPQLSGSRKIGPVPLDVDSPAGISDVQLPSVRTDRLKGE